MAFPSRSTPPLRQAQTLVWRDDPDSPTGHRTERDSQRVSSIPPTSTGTLRHVDCTGHDGTDQQSSTLTMTGTGVSASVPPPGPPPGPPPVALSSPPGAPTIGTATVGNAQASVTWSAPASDGGAVITGYSVMATDATNG